MFTLEEYRERYSHSNSEELIALLGIDPDQLTPEARAALSEEAERRGLHLTTQAATAPFRYAKAPFADRLGAFLIDAAIALGPVIVAGLIGAIIDFGKPSKTTTEANIIGAMSWVLYYGFTKDGRGHGQSIGKRRLDLMVVNVKTDSPCTTGESLTRALMLWVLCTVPVVGWLIEPFAVLVRADGRRLGDIAAGTQVIRVNEYEAIRHTRD